MRDLLAISALSAYWSQADFPAIAQGLAELVMRSLPAELVVVRVEGADAGVRQEVVRTAASGQLESADASRVVRGLGQLLSSSTSSPPATVDNPVGDGTVRVVVSPLGVEGDLGCVAAASVEPGFPTQEHQLLLSAAANQATIILQHRRTEAALREADRRKDEFLATLAHELRNPLAPIRNGLQLLDLAGHDPAVLREARDLMQRQLAHLVRLIDDLMDVSRITRGKLELRMQPTELGAVLQSALETSRPLVEASDQQLTVDLPPEAIHLQADSTRLAQVFANLLNNAAQYTQQGGRIWLIAQRQGRSAVVRVRDTGVGIPAGMLARVFDMFTQVDQSLERRHGGLGIGLTLVGRLVAMHGGTVEARSEGPGRGSEFIVSLPLAEPEGQHESAQVAAGPRRGPARRILVADDNRDAADSLALILRLSGNDVRVAHDGQAAVELAVDFRPDAVLLDIGMPGVNGYDAARDIRQQPWGKQVTLIALTGWGQPEDRQRAVQAGFDHHLTKPLDPAALERLMAELDTTRPSDA